MKTLTKLEKSREFWFLLITSFLFFFLRLPSLFEPNWYGDEGIYQVLGLGIRHGLLLYRDIWDNKPPLLYVIYAFFHSDQFLIRLFSFIVGLITVVAFFFLAKALFFPKEGSPTKKHQFLVCSITTLFAILFGLPLIEGNIANAENFMLLPIITAGFFIFTLNHERKTPSYYVGFFLPGLLLGIAFLFKIVALFDFAAFTAFILLIHFGFKKIEKSIEILIPFGLGFLSPILFTLLFFFAKGALFDFIHAALIQNVGYVGYANTFIIPQGFLILKTGLLGLFLLVLFVKRTQISPQFLFCLVWLAFSVFNAFFSQRPYTHYVLVTLPSLCLTLGLFMQEKKLKSAAFFAVIISVFLLVKNFTYFGKTIFYYQNFFLFVTNHESVFSYRDFFDSNTQKDYQLAEYLNAKLHSNDRVFIFGNNPQVYILINRVPVGKYAVAYHMTASKQSMDQTEKVLQKTHPRFVVINEKETFPLALFGYSQKMTINSTIIYERTF